MKLSAVLLFLLIQRCLFSQVTYTSANYGNAGDSLHYSEAIIGSGSSYNFSQAGANVNWNFSTLTPTSQYNFKFLAPDNAGYLNTFVNQCVAAGGTNNNCTTEFNSLTNVALNSNDSMFVSTYTFINLISHDEKTTDSLITNILGLSEVTRRGITLLTATYTQPDVVYVFPIAYGKSDSSNSSYIVNLGERGDVITYNVHAKRVNQVDAWGGITSPFATYASTVRMRTTITYTDTLFTRNTPTPIAPYTDVIYSWFDSLYVAPVFIANGQIIDGQEEITSASYLDTMVCLPPIVTVNYTPLVPYISARSNNVRVTFTNSSSNANSFLWNFGDPGSGNMNTSTAANPAHTYTAAGVYNVSLIVCNTTCTPERCDTTTFALTVYDTIQLRAAFTARPASVCADQAVRFTNTSTNATSYVWLFGDGDSSTVKDPTHDYTTSGSYVVVLYAMNGATIDSAKETITVESLPTATIASTGTLTFCYGDSVTLYASGGTRYRWSNGREGSTITVKTSGSYSVTATNACGTASAGPVVVTVNTQVDTLTALGSTSFCEGDSVILQANTGTGFTYEWTRNGRVIGGATQSTYTAKTAGNYVVDVFQNGCGGVSNTITVTVGTTPTVTIYIQSSSVICSNDSLLISSETGGGFGNTYQWQLNGQAISGATNSTYYARVTGDYTLLITRNGCSVTSNGIKLTVVQTPAPVLSYTGNGGVCQGDSLMLSTAAGTGYTYQWQSNGHNIAGATSTYYYAKIAAIYSVVVTNQGCAGTSNTLNLRLNPNPVANAGRDTSITGCGLASVTIGGNPTGSGGTGTLGYSWTPPSGLDSTDVSNPTVTNLGATTVYTVVVTDANGCSASNATTVTVVGSSLSVSITSVGSPNWCFGTTGSITMTAVPSTSGTYLYNWSPATGLSDSTSISTTATPTSPGIYDYTVLVTNGSGCQASANLQVQVFALPVATITALDTTALCEGDTANLTAAPGGGYGYQWLSDGNILSGDTSINFATGDSGTYSVKVTSNGCSQVSSPISVTVKPQPSAVIAASGSLSFCAGGSVLLYADDSTDNTYQWYEDGDNIIGATSGSYTTGDSANFYAIATLNGCSQQSNTLVTSVYQYAPDSIVVIGSQVFCKGDSSLLQIVTGTGNTYQWQLNGNNIPGDTSEQLYVLAPGIYYSQVTTINNCTSTSLGVPISVNQYPMASVTPNGVQSFCTGDSLLLTASVGTGYSYQWLLDGDTIANANDLYFTAYDSGSYTVEVTQNGCTDQSSTAAQVIVNPYPPAIVTAASNLLCPGDTMSLYANTGTGYSYAWQSGGNNINNSQSDSSSYIVGIPGAYDVVLTAAGCSTTSNIVDISYSPPPVITQDDSVLIATPGFDYQWYNDSAAIPGASHQTYLPQASGDYSVIVTDSTGCSQPAADYYFTYTSIANINDDYANISVFPNPAHESVSIILGMNREANITIQLVDIVGNIVASVYEGKAKAGNSFYQLSVANLPQGIYLVKFYDDKNVATTKIVKE